MSSKGADIPASVDETTLQDTDLATNQETIPVPYLAGTQRYAVRWLDAARNMITEQAPQQGGKGK